MQALLRLEVDYYDVKSSKLSEENIILAKKRLFKKSIAQFKIDAQEIIESNKLKIINDLFLTNDILVEYDENDPSIKEKLLKIPIVMIIDYHVGKGVLDKKDKIISPQEQLMIDLELKIQKRKK